MNEKVSRLEKMVDELTKKVINQETEKVKEIDKNSESSCKKSAQFRE